MESLPAPRRHYLVEKCQSPLSSSSTLGTTRNARTGRECLPAPPPDERPKVPLRRRRLLLEDHSQSTAVQSPGGLRQAPGTTPVAAHLPALVTTSTQRVTRLAGLGARDLYAICPAFRLGIVSGPFGPISGGRRQKLPRTQCVGHSPPRPHLSAGRGLFGVVSRCTHRQALPVLVTLRASRG